MPRGEAGYLRYASKVIVDAVKSGMMSSLERASLYATVSGMWK